MIDTMHSIVFDKCEDWSKEQTSQHNTVNEIPEPKPIPTECSSNHSKTEHVIYYPRSTIWVSMMPQPVSHK